MSDAWRMTNTKKSCGINIFKGLQYGGDDVFLIRQKLIGGLSQGGGTWC